MSAGNRGFQSGRNSGFVRKSFVEFSFRNGVAINDGQWHSFGNGGGSARSAGGRNQLRWPQASPPTTAQGSGVVGIALVPSGAPPGQRFAARRHWFQSHFGGSNFGHSSFSGSRFGHSTFGSFSNARFGSNFGGSRFNSYGGFRGYGNQRVGNSIWLRLGQRLWPGYGRR